MGTALRTKKGLLTALCLAVILCIGATTPAYAAGLLIADGGFGGVLEIREHTVNVTINNGIAVTEVTQVFQNMEDRQVEALYTFPVPAKASVANFSMWINDVEMVGEVVEKERAREIYETYKQQPKPKDPGLLEQLDYRTFEMRIFPIGPGAEQRVQIAYYQELDQDHDWATYVYPLATATRPTVDTRVSGRFALTMSVRSEVPIVEMDSPSHNADFVFAAHNDAFHEASLETPEGSLARDVVVAYHTSRPRTGVDIITSRTSGEDGYFCLMVTAGEELAGLVTGMDYVFVLDVSGSMRDDRKLDTSLRSVGAFVEALGEEDRFELVAFNAQPVKLFGKLAPVSADTITQAQEFLDRQSARGGTELRPAIAATYRYAEENADRTLNVVVLSDGLTEQRDRPGLVQTIRSRPGNVRVFCVGVGNDVNRPLLDQLAEEAGGLAAVVSRGDNFERQAQAFRRKLTHPVATNLNVTFSGDVAYDIEPPRLPNLFHGTPVRMYGRYTGSGPVNVQVSADVEGFGFDSQVAINLPQEDSANPEIERMWAWHRVQRLLKEADAAGGRDEVIDEIVWLGEGYSIATEYTSFLVLENDDEYQRWQIERRNVLRLERDRRAQRELREQLDSMRMASLDRLGTAQTGEPEKPKPADQKVARRVDLPNREGLPNNSPGQNFDLNFPGAGAIDPITGGIAAGLAALAVASRKRKR